MIFTDVFRLIQSPAHIKAPRSHRERQWPARAAGHPAKEWGSAMSRGPLPVIGLDAAQPFAKARGQVSQFRRSPGNTGDLMIAGNGCLAIVTVRKATRLHETLAEVEKDYRDALLRIRIIPGGGPVSRELWLYSRYRVFRFFRVMNAGIVELCTDGKILESSPAGPAVADPVAPPARPEATMETQDHPAVTEHGGEGR